MGQIYRNATLTLAAANATKADDGFLKARRVLGIWIEVSNFLSAFPTAIWAKLSQSAAKG